MAKRKRIDSIFIYSLFGIEKNLNGASDVVAALVQRINVGAHVLKARFQQNAD